MSDPTPPEIRKLVAGCYQKPAFDADSVTRDIVAQRRTDCVIERETYALLLEQRKVIALERIADALTTPCNAWGETAVEAIGGNIGRALSEDRQWRRP